MVVNSLTEVKSIVILAGVSNLVYFRTARGLSQSALAKLAGVSQPLIWQLEHRSDPKGLRTAYAIAAALRVKVTDIWPEALPQRRTQHRPVRPAQGRTQTDVSGRKIRRSAKR